MSTALKPRRRGTVTALGGRGSRSTVRMTDYRGLAAGGQRLVITPIGDKMPTPAITDVEHIARDERTVSEVVESLVSEHGGEPWGQPDFQDRLQRVLSDERLTAKRLVGAYGHLDLSMVFPSSDSDIATRLVRAVSSDNGLLIVAGPTGSGKTVTLTAIARHLVSTGRRVGSLADTFELLVRRYPGILRSDLDHDALFPRFFSDIIIPDEYEICSTETALDAMRASRANPVLATMHGRVATRIPKRLVWTASPKVAFEPPTVARRRPTVASDDLDHLVGPWSFNWGIRSGELHGSGPLLRLFVVCQQLVRKLCASCSSDGEPRGCGECHRGYCGFTALAETIKVEVQSIADLSTQDFSTHETYRPFDEHAAALVANKVTTQAEIRRVLGRGEDTGLVERGAVVAGGVVEPLGET